MVNAYIGLGSNLGNCRENILQAWSRLGEVKGVKLLTLSSPYRSEPVGMESANWFINAVGCLQTSLPARQLLSEMLRVEADLGRKRGMKGTPEDRIVDLDLLYWDDMICEEPEMVLPHPEIANRLFVLLPLAEIEPDMRHPVSRKTSLKMLQEYMAEESTKDQNVQVQKSSWSPVNN
jgi:2-amino-4-hydroxy-6-hydroxymethyldihydropteridine diphosphokinase